MKAIKELFQGVRSFGTVYALEVYFINPFFYNGQSFGWFSFDTGETKGHGVNLLIIGINIKRSLYKERR